VVDDENLPHTFASNSRFDPIWDTRHRSHTVEAVLEPGRAIARAASAKIELSSLGVIVRLKAASSGKISIGMTVSVVEANRTASWAMLNPAGG
jgi:hypothetical protein